ncbi:14180_t:CDS:2 [Acaulospora morrowiae]|uniref:14180_t:CDS:1 n=1 Tax=Acaulospora morrowiae TaxID=94023 RepID=A0A9N8WF16_9GLOM|nr:14180_t:CDS:2 [Acaulospora morrowiae]
MSSNVAPSESNGDKRAGPSNVVPVRDKRLKTIACDRCRRRKVKCDGDGYNKLPCKYCASVDLECTYNGRQLGRVSNANDHSSATNDRSNQSTNDRNSPTRSSRSPTTASNVPSINNTSNSVMLRQRKTISRNNRRSSLSLSAPSRVIPKPLPAFDDREYIIKLFTLMTMNNEAEVRQKLINYLPPQQEKPMSEQRPSLAQNTAPVNDVRLIETLVDLYFRNFHPLFPIVHKSYFMESFKNPTKTVPRFLLYAMCTIGSNYLDNRSAWIDPHIGSSYYYHAQGEVIGQIGKVRTRLTKKRMQLHNTGMVDQFLDKATLSTATALLLLGIFGSLNFKGRVFVGMATTFAITMGLHDKNASENFSVNKREARKMIWWGISIVNRLECMALNRPLLLEEKHCTVDYPDPNLCDESESKIIGYFVQYSIITRIMYDILEISMVDDQGSDFSVSHLEGRLDEWKRNLPSFLNIEDAKPLTITPDETTVEHLRIYLCILYNYTLIRIHHPKILSNNSLEACTQAANNITTLVNENFVSLINSNQFVIYCTLCAGCIHAFNLKSSQHSVNAKNSIFQIVEVFKSVLSISSLHNIHYGIKNLVVLFALQLEEAASGSDEQTMQVVKDALNVVTGNTRISENHSISTVVEVRHNGVGDDIGNIISNKGILGHSSSQPGINNILAQTATAGSTTGLPRIHQQSQPVFSSSPTSLSPLGLPPVNSGKMEANNNNNLLGNSSLISDNYTSSQYGQHPQNSPNHSSQTRSNGDNSSSMNNSYYYWTQHSNQLQPIQPQNHQASSHNALMSPTSETSTLLVLGNSQGSSAASMNIGRTATPSMTMTPTSSSLPPLINTTTSASTSIYLPFPQYSPAQQPSQTPHPSQPRQYYLTPSNPNPPRNYVAGPEIQDGLSSMTGMTSINGVSNGGAPTLISLLDNQRNNQSNEIGRKSPTQFHWYQT